jgi:hypothetical protein
VLVALFCCAALAAVARIVLVGDAPRRRFGARLAGATYVVAGSIAVLSAPSPLPAGVGLDPAWTVAIARAAAAHLVFGREIVFTYGPLGYLVTAFADRGNYVHMVALQVAVAMLMLAMVVERMRESTPLYQKVLLAFFVPLTLANSPFEVWPPVLVLLVLTRRNSGDRSEMPLMLGIGSFAGIFSLAKFSIGIDVGLIAGAFFAARFLTERGGLAGLERVATAAAAFAGAFLAASSAAFLALDYGMPAAIALEVLVFALLGAGAVSAYRRTGETSSRAWLVSVSAFPIIALGAAFSDSYRAFIESSVTMALGYSDAMSLDGPVWQVEAALLLLAAFAVAALSGANRASAAAMCALLAYEWAMFKLGFVRQDLHVLNFVAGAVFGAVLLAYRSSSRGGALAAGAVFVASLALFSSERDRANLPPLLAAFAPSSLARNVEAVVNVRTDAHTVDALDGTRLSGDALPGPMLRAVGDRPVDIVPAEATYAFANGLRWDPEPSLQTFMASRPALDALNERSLEGRRNDAILYTFGSIDGRYPIGDEPLAFRYTLCHYVAAAAPVSTSSGSVSLLLRAAKPRCGPLDASALAPVRWDEPVEIPHQRGRLTFARIVLDPNLAGRIYSFAFRAPIVHVSIVYDDGTTDTYRLAAADARDGVLVDPLPRSDVEAFALFGGTLAAHALSLTLSTDERWFHAPAIAFDLVALKR